MSAIARGDAAMLLLFDVAEEAVAEHDEWHTHEHMPERLGIPGFLRGTRWTSRDSPRYCVLYEVEALAVLDSAAYRERLDRPTPWTRAMMRHYLGMRRTLCRREATSGAGLGSTALVVRFAPAPGRAQELDRWLTGDVMPRVAGRQGLASVHLLRNALEAGMTREQEIRGRDASEHSVLFATGYDESAVGALAREDLGDARFVAHGAVPGALASGLYSQRFAIDASERP